MLGKYLASFEARSVLDKVRTHHNGGVVTILLYALTKGLINRALLAGSKYTFFPYDFSLL